MHVQHGPAWSGASGRPLDQGGDDGALVGRRGARCVSAVYGAPRTSVRRSSVMREVCQPAPSAYAAAARTSPASRPTSAAVSGCHCTADAEPVAVGLHRLERAVGGVRGRARSRGGRPPTGGGGSSRTSRSPSRPDDPGAGDGASPRPRRTRRRRGCAARARPGRACAGRARRRRGPPSPASRGRRRAPAAPAASAASSSAQLPGVPVRAPAGGARVRVGAVPRRVDVRAAGDHQPVEPGHHGVGRAVLRDRRQQQRDAAGGLDGVGVLRRAARRRAGARRPTPPPRGTS